MSVPELGPLYLYYIRAFESRWEYDSDVGQDLRCGINLGYGTRFGIWDKLGIWDKTWGMGRFWDVGQDGQIYSLF